MKKKKSFFFKIQLHKFVLVGLLWKKNCTSWTIFSKFKCTNLYLLTIMEKKFRNFAISDGKIIMFEVRKKVCFSALPNEIFTLQMVRGVLHMLLD